MQYDTLDVLSHFGVPTRNIEGDVLSVLCPFHEDNNPSGAINIKNGRYDCWACKTHTTVLAYLAKKYNKTLRDVYYAVGALDSTPSKYKTEDPANVERWHVDLFQQDDLLEELRKRAVSVEEIREHRLGAFVAGDGTKSIRIPIRNKRGHVIAFKDYRPGATEAKYYWPNVGVNRSNKKENRVHLLFPADQLAYPRILICGGEIKAIAAAKVLNPHDIGAVCGTGSESVAFSPNQLAAFRDKVVYVCYDVDSVGERNADTLCKHLRAYADSLHLIKLPLDVDAFPKGDVNDYIVHGGDLHALLKDSPLWEYVPPTFDSLEHDAPIETSLEKAVTASMAKKKVKIQTIISSMDTSPYSIPKDIKGNCDRNHKYCKMCKVHEMFTEQNFEVQLEAERLEVMEMVGQKLAEQSKILKKSFGIPLQCSSVQFDPQTFHHIEDIRVSQQLDISSRTNERSMQAAYYVGEERLELNEGYSMTGRMYPHPENQQATLLITEIENVEDALSTYQPKNLDALTVFKPAAWTKEELEKKLNDIYLDISHNVTEIYGRQDLHLLYDLAYHSALLLPNNLKGWVEVLVAGDSAQGKSLCANRLAEFYGLGERVICKGATVAGLLGGLQQHGKRWFASWGKIPTNDRRLVILDEVKGTREEVIASLTDMRSSGIAELTKIEKRRTNARTRLIMISNPRSDRVVKEYNNGVDIVKELIGSPEDVRRFDAIMVVRQGEVPHDQIYSRDRPKIEHKYTSELCRELVLYAWTVDKVTFEDPVYLAAQASVLTRDYVEDVPIIDTGTIREKVMRLATALAVRTFSVNNDGVVVRNCHVDYIAEFLNRLYSSDAFKYKEYSQKRLQAENLLRPTSIRNRILTKTPHPQELVYALLTTDDFDYQLFCDVLGWDPQSARNLLAFLNRHRALRKVGKVYRKTAMFARLLEDLERDLENELEQGRPEFVPDVDEEF